MPEKRRAESIRGRVLGWHRFPRRVAGVSFIFWLLVWDTGRTTFAINQGEHSWLDWIVLGAIAYSATAEYVLIPRLLAPKTLEREADPAQAQLMVASMRLAFAATSFVFGFVLLGAGADQWAATAALVASTLLLIPYVGETRANMKSL